MHFMDLNVGQCDICLAMHNALIHRPRDGNLEHGTQFLTVDIPTQGLVSKTHGHEVGPDLLGAGICKTEALLMRHKKQGNLAQQTV